jgi:hypothetical protein
MTKRRVVRALAGFSFNHGGPRHDNRGAHMCLSKVFPSLALILLVVLGACSSKRHGVVSDPDAGAHDASARDASGGDAAHTNPDQAGESGAAGHGGSGSCAAYAELCRSGADC